MRKLTVAEPKTSIIPWPFAIPAVLDHDSIRQEIVAHQSALATLERDDPRRGFHLVQVEQRNDLILADSAVAALQQQTIPAKPFVFYSKAQAGEPFYVHVEGSKGWRCEPMDQNLDLVPAFAREILQTAIGMPFPFTDVIRNGTVSGKG